MQSEAACKGVGFKGRGGASAGVCALSYRQLNTARRCALLVGAWMMIVSRAVLR